MITLTESETLRARVVGAAEPVPSEQWCWCEECSSDEHVFYVDDEKSAEADLRAALAEWARKHMGTNCPWRAADAPDAADEVRALQARLRGAL